MIEPSGLLQASALELTYAGQLRALVNIDLEIPRGQFVSVIGPSGCGKSSLLRIMAGLVPPTAGTMLLDGQPPAAARQTRQRMSFVFQDPTLLAWRNVRENVALPLELAGVANDQRAPQVAAAVRLARLDEFADRFPSELSGGMRMRASLARALVTEPELLLLDEPFGALDDLTRQSLGEELYGLWHERRWTVVFVTHNIAEAVFLSERIVVLSARPGRIVADLHMPFSAPRTPGLRSQAAFAQLTGEVAAWLRKGASQ